MSQHTSVSDREKNKNLALLSSERYLTFPLPLHYSTKSALRFWWVPEVEHQRRKIKSTCNFHFANTSNLVRTQKISHKRLRRHFFRDEKYDSNGDEKYFFFLILIRGWLAAMLFAAETTTTTDLTWLLLRQNFILTTKRFCSFSNTQSTDSCGWQTRSQEFPARRVDEKSVSSGFSTVNLKDTSFEFN